MTDRRTDGPLPEFGERPEIVELPRSVDVPPDRRGGHESTARARDTMARHPKGADALALPPTKRRIIARAGDGRQIVCEGLVRIYKVADLEVVALQGLDLVVGVGRDDRDRRRLGQRQVDAPQHPRRARRAVGRSGGRRRPRPAARWAGGNGRATGGGSSG